MRSARVSGTRAQPRVVPARPPCGRRAAGAPRRARRDPLRALIAVVSLVILVRAARAPTRPRLALGHPTAAERTVPHGQRPGTNNRHDELKQNNAEIRPISIESKWRTTNLINQVLLLVAPAFDHIVTTEYRRHR
jgi:hypothetical protein